MMKRNSMVVDMSDGKKALETVISWVHNSPVQLDVDVAIAAREELASLEAAKAKAEAERDKFHDALEEIVQWSEAYPLDIFPEPDFKKARQLLEAGGMTLDGISASNMRHVVEGVGKIARQALKDTQP